MAYFRYSEDVGKIIDNRDIETGVFVSAMTGGGGAEFALFCDKGILLDVLRESFDWRVADVSPEDAARWVKAAYDDTGIPVESAKTIEAADIKWITREVSREEMAMIDEMFVGIVQKRNHAHD